MTLNVAKDGMPLITWDMLRVQTRDLRRVAQEGGDYMRRTFENISKDNPEYLGFVNAYLEAFQPDAESRKALFFGALAGYDLIRRALESKSLDETAGTSSSH